MQRGDRTVIEGGCGPAGQHQAQVLDATTGGAYRRADVFGPPPAGLVCSATENLTANPHDLVAALLHPTHFIGFLEPPEDHAHLLRTDWEIDFREAILEFCAGMTTRASLCQLTT
jgi:hypothetical protein